MAQFEALESLVYLALGMFVFLSVGLKCWMRKMNGFDALAIAVLVTANLNPYLKQFGYIVSISLTGIVVAALASGAGASRRGILFLSSVIIFSDVLAESSKIVGEIEGLENCAPEKIATVLQGTLLSMMLYASTAEDNLRDCSSETELQMELKLWLCVIIGCSTARSFFATLTCDHESKVSVELTNFLRTILLVAACVANGADETVQDE
jgi:hypothetical protein